MIFFLMLLRTHWQITFLVLMMLFSFFAGWRFHTLVYEAGEVKQIEADYNISGIFERTQADINKLYDNLNIRTVYENPNSCLIPANELRLLIQVTN